jgi:hypothetical protein
LFSETKTTPWPQPIICFKKKMAHGFVPGRRDRALAPLGGCSRKEDESVNGGRFSFGTKTHL